MHFTVLQVVATVLAFSAQFSRIFAATKPFWGKLPAVVQVWLPPILPFVAALQAQVAGATTWTDFAVAAIVSAALLVPGAPSNRSAAPLQSAKPFNPPPMAILFILACFASGFATSCAHWKPVAKTIDQAAIILCDVFFSQQPQAVGLSPKDVEKAFCSTAEQVAPFLESAKGAMGRAGAVRLARPEQ